MNHVVTYVHNYAFQHACHYCDSMCNYYVLCIFQRKMKKAEMQPNLGGTELMGPLEYISIISVFGAIAAFLFEVAL